MNDARYISQERKEDIDPEMQPDANLEEYTQRRQDNGQQNSNNIHVDLLIRQKTEILPRLRTQLKGLRRRRETPEHENQLDRLQDKVDRIDRELQAWRPDHQHTDGRGSRS